MEVTGDDRIVENLKAMEGNIQGEVGKALKLSGVLVEGEAKKITPVDTGRLRLSINSKSDDEKVDIGTNVEYAPYVELGTSKQTAQPFLRPALLYNVNNIKKIFQEAVKNGTIRVVK